MTDSITLRSRSVCGATSANVGGERAGRETQSISSCGLLVALPGEDAEADETEHVSCEAPCEEQEVGRHDAADEQHQA